MRTKRKLFRILALATAMNMLISTLLPTVSWALTSGPSQPEFSSFEPVATTNMVNEFTGDFTYNLPLISVPGPMGSSYPISLSYHSGVNQEQEASWVGFGWTLNAGAINRAKRGIADDTKNKSVTQYNKTPTNWTATASIGNWVEAFGVDKLQVLNGQLSLRYNNYRGFGYNFGSGIKLGKGLFDIGYGISDGELSFSLSPNPGRLLNGSTEKASKLWKLNDEKKNKKYQSLVTKRKYAIEARASNWGSNYLSSLYNAYKYGESTKSTQLKPYSGNSYNVSFATEVDFFGVPIGPSVNVYGSYTAQTNLAEFNSRAFGLMYSGDADELSSEERDEALMDYHIENGSSFNKRDAVLGVPFNDADQFMVTGEGVGGGFRMYHRNLGHFGPQKAESKVDIWQAGGETHFGGVLGWGVDVGVGNKVSKLGDWNKHPEGSAFSKLSDNSTVDEPVFFRFNNDMGGSWGDEVNDSPFRATLDGTILNGNNFSLNESDKFKYQPHSTARSGRSSYIGFTVNKDTYSSGNNPSYKAYSKRSDLILQAAKSQEDLEDKIGELAVFNENGTRYVYGLPVYSKDEETVSFGIEGGTVKNNSLVHYEPNDIDSYFGSPKTMVGQKVEDAYATSFLLTEITGPDYVDRNLDGPTEDDFGGYTRFNYDKIYGNSSEKGWFNWRMPYNGLSYQKNSISDKKDDLGTVTRGKKEIYYLQSVETKSHVAVFHTSDRDGDAFGAPDIDEQIDPAMVEGSQSGDKLRKLDRIDLYTVSSLKNQYGQLQRNSEGNVVVPAGAIPIKTVHFEYHEANEAEELAKGGPNNMTYTGIDGSPQKRGKLTLKKVYFEYNGKSNKVGGVSRISPYLFEYNYPQFNTYPAKYTSGDDDVTIDTGDTGIQNPDYSEFNTDAWGNFQPNGAERHLNMQSWLDQRLVDNKSVGGDPVFDPAAWQLKVIKLPSGGEIHVQYESDNYQYVQDQEAHVMASLSGSDNPETSFIIDHASIGITPERAAEYETDVNSLLNRTVSMIRDRYVNGNNKIHFKFLYTLTGGNEPSFSSCNTEYITGYASVESVRLTGGQIVVQLDADQLPRKVCKEFTKANRLGMIDPNGNCDASLGLNDGGHLSVVRQLAGLIGGIAIPGNLCSELDETNSYFRIPTPLAKRGGGLRVKRLLTYDKGFEGNGVLYGNEYIYKTTDIKGNLISSGVATNEPQTMREENVLIDLMERGKQDLLSKVVAGKDKKEQEGLIGEGIYPGPSVGYSKVYIRNIHTGETNPGYQVNEFYTAFDKPVISEDTELKSKLGFLAVNVGPASYFLKQQFAAQGFSFVLNNMHGQVRRMASYAGKLPDNVLESNNVLVAEQIMEYFEPNDEVPVLNQAFGTIQTKKIGREVDITLAQKKFKENSYDAVVEMDVSKPLFIPPIVSPVYVTAVPTLDKADGAVSTHATSKVVRYPAIVKRTISYQDGIKHVTEPMAFDAYTGKPVSTKTYDEFVGAYLSQDIKASWEYPNMRDRASAEGKLIQASFELDDNLMKVAEGQECDLRQFTRGDLIEFGDGTNALYHVVDIDYVTESLVVVRSQQHGDDFPATTDHIRIIRSGRTNALNASVGSVTMHDEEDFTQLHVIDQNLRYITEVNNDFVKDLNTTMNGLSGTNGTFTLTGNYPSMDMSAYQQDLAEDINWKEADITNVEFKYTMQGEKVRVDLMAFEIACSSCAGGWYRVAAPGW